MVAKKSAKPTITITHLYPKSMNIYGDTGNVLTLKQRLVKRGYKAEIAKIDIGQKIPKETDIIVAGGGQDAGQIPVAADLQKKKKQLLKMRDDGVPMIVICGTYQLFGNYFITHDGLRMEGIGIFDMYTEGRDLRMIGNITTDSGFGELVGFENHSGQTFLAEGQDALATISRGEGNNAEDYFEGAVSVHAIGTYMHGPFLPKNPAVADFLIEKALNNRGIDAPLSKLSDKLEKKAAQTAKSRPR